MKKMFIKFNGAQNQSYMPNKSDKETLIVGVGTDYYTFKHLPCCFPVPECCILVIVIVYNYN